LGATALIVGANLPDVDVLAYLAGPAADLEWRRGWTHGILAVAVLPLLLTGALVLLHRAIQARRVKPSPVPLNSSQLLLLSFIAILSHPVLDTLNTYGVRWLMPLSGTWYYGDTLFIVDPWVWGVLALGVTLSWRRDRANQQGPDRPARVAISLFLVYALAMASSGAGARAIIRREVEELSGKRVLSMMASPVAFNPLVRRFVVEQEGEYRVGSFNWLRHPRVSREVQTFRRGEPDHPAVRTAARTPAGRRFLMWARFPTFTAEQRGAGEFLVHLVDLRYANRPDVRFGAMSIPVHSEVTW
jgi:inner membrane protein